MTIPVPISPAEEKAFREGWRTGYSDGGEHDCRMFAPTEHQAWLDYIYARIKREVGRDAASEWYRSQT